MQTKALFAPRMSLPEDPLPPGRLLKGPSGYTFFVEEAGTLPVRVVVDRVKQGEGLKVTTVERPAYIILSPPQRIGANNTKSFWTRNLSRKWTRADLERAGVICATLAEKNHAMALQSADCFTIGDPEHARRNRKDQEEHAVGDEG